MSVDRGHDIPTGYPTLGDNAPEQVVQHDGTYHIPEQQGVFQGDLGPDATQELVDRTAGNIDVGNVPDEDEENQGFWTRTKVAIAAGAAAVTAAAVFGGWAATNRNGNETASTGTETTIGGPVNPGPVEPSPSETVSTTLEKEPLTSENVEFTVEGIPIPYKGVMTDNGIVANFGVFRQNDPNLPPPTQKEGMDMIARYGTAVKVMNNLMVSDEVAPFRDEAMDKLLFKPGTSGALESFVKGNQANGTKIVDVRPFNTLEGKPEKYNGVDLVQGGIYVTTDKGETFRISLALENVFGAMRNNGTSYITKEK